MHKDLPKHGDHNPQMLVVDKNGPGGMISVGVIRGGGSSLRFGSLTTEEALRQHFETDNFDHGKIGGAFLQTFVELTSSTPRLFVHRVDIHKKSGIDSWYAIGKYTDDPGVEVTLCSMFATVNVKKPYRGMMWELMIGLKENGDKIDFKPKEKGSNKSRRRRVNRIIQTEYDAKLVQVSPVDIEVECRNDKMNERFGALLRGRLIELRGKNRIQPSLYDVPVYG